MKTPRLIDRVGPSPDIHSWGYFDTILRTTEYAYHSPTPKFQRHWYTPGFDLWLPLSLTAPAVGQSACSHANANSPLTINITATASGGTSTIILFAGDSVAADTISTITDSSGAQSLSGTQWKHVASTRGTTTNLMSDMYYCPNSLSITSVTVDWTTESNAEFAGVVEVTNASAISGTASNAVGSAQNFNGATASPTAADAIVVVGGVGGTPNFSYTGCTNFTNLFKADNAGNRAVAMAALIVASASGTYIPAWTSDGSDVFSSATAAFKGSAAVADTLEWRGCYPPFPSARIFNITH